MTTFIERILEIYGSRRLTLALLITCGVLLVGAGAAVYFVHRSAEAARFERDLGELRIQALADSTRLLRSYRDENDSLRTLYARRAYPDEDSLRAALTEEVRQELKKSGRDAIGSVEFEHEAPVDSTSGTVDAVPDDSILTFDIATRVGIVDLMGQLQVDVNRAALTYQFKADPVPQRFRVYATDKGGAVEFWLDVPNGTATILHSYVKPPPVIEKKVDTFDWQTRLIGLVSPNAVFGGPVSGPHFRRDDGRFELGIGAGYGFAGPPGAIERHPFLYFEIIGNLF